jgi:hypothetical protein
MGTTPIFSYRMLQDLIDEAYKGVLFYRRVATGEVSGATFVEQSKGMLDEMEQTIREITIKNFNELTVKTEQFNSFMMAGVERERHFNNMAKQQFGSIIKR